jgi:hypothetical protein
VSLIKRQSLMIHYLIFLVFFLNSRGGGPITLDALRDMESDSSDDDDNHEAFYTGGSESSGQQVLGPAKNRDEIIAEMFKKAKQ